VQDAVQCHFEAKEMPRLIHIISLFPGTNLSESAP